MEEENLDFKTVFTIKHSDIPKGITQCAMKKHIWRKVNDNELECAQCPTIIIVNPEVIDTFL